MHRSKGGVLLMHRSNGKVLLICIDLRYLRDIMIFDINRYPMRTLATRLVATRRSLSSTVRKSSSTVRKMNIVHESKLGNGTFPPSLEAANSEKTYHFRVCFCEVVKLETRVLLEPA
jgi:hypothetical protein